MNKKSRCNLAIAVVLAILGVAAFFGASMLYEFRMNGGYTIPESKFLVVLLSMWIILLEGAVKLVAAGLVFLAGMGVVSLIKKRRR